MNKTYDETDWNDITSELREACGKLRLGELVHEPSFGMFEAMSAIEIGDPKMDSGMLIDHCKNRPRSVAQVCKHLDGLPQSAANSSVNHHSHSESSEQNSIQASQTRNGEAEATKHVATIKLQDFSTKQLIGIVDELFACFVTWLDGSSPMQTVYVSWHLQHMEVVRDGWLRSILVVFSKLVDHTRNRVSQSGVYDEEEFQISTTVVPRSELPDQRAASALKEVEDELNKRIRAAKQRQKLAQNGADTQDATVERELSALCVRVRFTRCFFLALLNLSKDGNAHADECERQLAAAAGALEDLQNSLDVGWRSAERVNNDVVYTDDEYYQCGFDSYLNHRLVAAVIPRCAQITSRRAAYTKLAACVVQLRVALNAMTQLRDRDTAPAHGEITSHYDALCAFLRWFTRTHAPSVLVRACLFALIYPKYDSTARLDVHAAAAINRARLSLPVDNDPDADPDADPDCASRQLPALTNTISTRFESILSLSLFGGPSPPTQSELTRTSLRVATNPLAFNLLEQCASFAAACSARRVRVPDASAKDREDRVTMSRETTEKLVDAMAQLEEFLAQLSSTQFARISALCLNCSRQHERLAHTLDDLSVLQDDADRLDGLFRDLLNEARSRTAASTGKAAVIYKDLPEPQESCFGAFVLLCTFDCVMHYVQSSFELELYSHTELHYVYWFLSDILFSYLHQVLTMCERAFVHEFDRCAAITKRERKAGSSKKHNHAKEREKDGTAQNSREWKFCMRQRMFTYAQQQLSNGLLRFIAALAIDGRYEVGSFRFTDEETRFRNRFRFFGAHLLNSNQLFDTYRSAWLKLTDPQHAAAAATECGCESHHSAHSHQHHPHEVPSRAQLVASHYSQASQCFNNALQGFENLQRELSGSEKNKPKPPTQSSPKAKAPDSAQKTDAPSSQNTAKTAKNDETVGALQRPMLTDFWQLGALVRVAKTNAVVSNIFQRAATARAANQGAPAATIDKRVSFDFTSHACYPVLKLL